MAELQPPLATVEHFMSYFAEHPLAETQHVQQVLGAALISQLVEQGPIEPLGYINMVTGIIYDHEIGRDTQGERVPVVIQDSMRALLYCTEMNIWARRAVGDEFADQMIAYMRQAEFAAERDDFF